MLYFMKILPNLIVAAIVVFGCSSSVPQPNNVINEHQPEKLENFISDGWYVSPPLSVEEIEQEAMKELVRYQQSPNARKDVPMVPFGFANDEWNVFKSKVEPGDEIRKITAPSEYWQRLAGWEGYVLVREGLIIWQMMTRIN
jgi:hypothetical protein